MALPKPCTEDDYDKLPEDIRAELIDGKIYFQAAPSQIHQEILMFLSKSHNFGDCSFADMAAAFFHISFSVLRR